MTIIDNLPYPESYGVNSERASNPKYSRIIQRKKSFFNEDYPAPAVLCRMIDSLVDAGFYFSLHRDYVICYDCGLMVHKWKEGDNPWELHILHVSDCPHVLRSKTTHYIEEILSTQQTGRKSLEFFEEEVSLQPQNNVQQILHVNSGVSDF